MVIYRCIEYDWGKYCVYSIGDKIVYGEHGVCTVEKIAPLDISGVSRGTLYYHLSPMIGSGTYFAPVDSGAFMRPVMDRSEAEALIDAMPGIQPAICNDNRFNHVDAFYKDLFRSHSCEALVSIVKGLNLRITERKTKSSRAEATMKRAKDMLHGELAVALGMDLSEVEPYIRSRIGTAE